MRHASRRDANHHEIKTGLEERGFGVVDLSMLGDGAPDLLVTHGERYALLELKTRTGRLSKRQKEFHKACKGRIYVARSLVQALAAIGAVRAE